MICRRVGPFFLVCVCVCLERLYQIEHFYFISGFDISGVVCICSRQKLKDELFCMNFLRHLSYLLPLETESQIIPACPSRGQDTEGPSGPTSHPESYSKAQSLMLLYSFILWGCTNPDSSVM